jgi:hypothetical protein
VQWQVLVKGSTTWKSISTTQNPTANTNTLVVTTAAADNGSQYRAVFTVGTNSVTSLAAMLTLLVPPAITSSPTTQTVAVNTPVTFQATATGSPAGVQWQVSTDGGLTYSNIAGATLSKYTLIAQAMDDGNLLSCGIHQRRRSRRHGGCRPDHHAMIAGPGAGRSSGVNPLVVEKFSRRPGGTLSCRNRNLVPWAGTPREYLS